MSATSSADNDDDVVVVVVVVPFGSRRLDNDNDGSRRHDNDDMTVLDEGNTRRRSALTETHVAEAEGVVFFAGNA